MQNNVLNPFLWCFESGKDNLSKQNYLKDLDFIKVNTFADTVVISAR